MGDSAEEDEIAEGSRRQRGHKDTERGRMGCAVRGLYSSSTASYTAPAT